MRARSSAPRRRSRAALRRIADLLDQLREFGELRETSPAEFELESRPFLHFHHRPDGRIVADVRLSDRRFVPFDVSEAAGQQEVLAAIESHLANRWTAESRAVVMLPDPESLIEEQLAFYRADATAYDAWDNEVFAKGGGGRLGEDARRERRILLSELRQFDPRGHVLELAAGTGTYTAVLLETAEAVTAVDASPESLTIARGKLEPHARRLDLIEADLFSWRPDRRYDTVFFAFWLSHVPPDRFDGFWQLVREALRPGGRVFFIDSGGGPEVGDATHAPTHEVVSARSSYREWDCLRSNVGVRELNGRRYHVVKVSWKPLELQERLARLGWRASVRQSTRAIWGCAMPAV